AHFNLFSQKLANDRWGNLLVAYWFFLDVRQYRRLHWDHHVKHGQTDDPENSYFEPLTLNNLVRAVTGLKAATKFRDWESHKPKVNVANERSIAGRQPLMWFGLYQTAILSLFAWQGAWLAYGLVWIVPVFCGFPFLAFVRQV